MISKGSVELSLLHVRINELERRLARLEEHLTGSGTATAEETTLAAEPGHDGLEGARLVALEMLSSGYERHEVATYLRSTFGISDTETVLNGAGLVSG